MSRPSLWTWAFCPLALSFAGCTQPQNQGTSPQSIKPHVEPISSSQSDVESGAQIPKNIPREQWAKWMLKHARSQRATGTNIERQSKDPATLTAMVSMESKGEYAQVIAASQHLAQTTPPNAQVCYLTGRAHYFQGQFEAAKSYWDKAIAIDAGLRPQIQPLQDQMGRIRQKYPNLQLKPVVLVPSDAKIQESAIIERAVSLLKARRFAELDKTCQQLHDNGKVGINGYSKEFVFCNTLATPYYRRGNGSEAKQIQASEKAWGQMFAVLEEWKRVQPHSKWAPLILFRAWGKRAWDIRGGEYAHKIPQQQWQRVQSALEKAAKIASALPDSVKESPVFWQTTLSFSLLAGVPREQIEVIHEQAAAHRFTDRTIDFEMATTLLPRWLGQPGEWQRWIVARADAIGGEAGDIAYGQMILEVSDIYGEGKFWKEVGLSWPRAKRGFEAMLRRQPNSVSLATWLLVNAQENHDMATAKSMVLRLNNRANKSRWFYPRDFAVLRMHVLDSTS